MSCAVQLKKMTGNLLLNMKTTCCLETTFQHYLIVRPQLLWWSQKMVNPLALTRMPPLFVMSVRFSWLYRCWGIFGLIPRAILMTNLGFIIKFFFTFGSNLGPLILGSDVVGSNWYFFRSNNCHMLTVLLGPFLFKDCIMYTLGSLWWSTMTNNSDL